MHTLNIEHVRYTKCHNLFSFYFYIVLLGVIFKPNKKTRSHFMGQMNIITK